MIDITGVLFHALINILYSILMFIYGQSFLAIIWQILFIGGLEMRAIININKHRYSDTLVSDKFKVLWSILTCSCISVFVYQSIISRGHVYILDTYFLYYVFAFLGYYFTVMLLQELYLLIITNGGKKPMLVDLVKRRGNYYTWEDSMIRRLSLRFSIPLLLLVGLVLHSELWVHAKIVVSVLWIIFSLIKIKPIFGELQESS